TRPTWYPCSFGAGPNAEGGTGAYSVSVVVPCELIGLSSPVGDVGSPTPVTKASRARSALESPISLVPRAFWQRFSPRALLSIDAARTAAAGSAPRGAPGRAQARACRPRPFARGRGGRRRWRLGAPRRARRRQDRIARVRDRGGGGVSRRENQRRGRGDGAPVRRAPAAVLVVPRARREAPATAARRARHRLPSAGRTASDPVPRWIGCPRAVVGGCRGRAAADRRRRCAVARCGVGARPHVRRAPPVGGQDRARVRDARAEQLAHAPATAPSRCPGTSRREVAARVRLAGPAG